ncbi:hypothetical protein CCYN2B_290016 [Capnocytophaga cynodegmi]|uniref:Uncharacterized protein n=1 Tax=Capnocytophaga cynodegmi TaxID=28189 RepID=A0A0B7H856_9FLAO|nr:hypothetical protein CCYN2B_290016 [Capnocytophaga cynodegmi]
MGGLCALRTDEIDKIKNKEDEKYGEIIKKRTR